MNLREETEAKAKIIISVIDFLDNRSNNMLVAVEYLKKLAQFYGVTIKGAELKENQLPLKESLRKFIANQDGYLVTINQLYTSIKLQNK